MVSHDLPEDAGDARLTVDERRRRALGRLDDGHIALLTALEGVGDTEAFLGSRWSVWEVMQHLLTENFVAALEEIASGEREMLPAFEGRGNRIANDIARLEENYQRFRKLIIGCSEEQLNRPATPPNPENDFPGLSLLELIERVSGHEGNHARQVRETRKFVAEFRAEQRAVTVAGLGAGDASQTPLAVRELLANADYVAGTERALSRARQWMRGVALELRQDNRDELLNRLARDSRAGLWSMVVTLGDPAESAPGLVEGLRGAADAVALLTAPGFYQAALAAVGVSPLDAVCASAERVVAGESPASGVARAVAVLGGDAVGRWRCIGDALLEAGFAGDARVRLVTGLASGDAPSVRALTLRALMEEAVGDTTAAIDAALVLG